MLVGSPKQDGFSLIELMIGIALVALLMMMGVPAFSTWVQNSQVRTAAESIQNGLQIARAEAVQRNARVRFNLTDAGGTVVWSVDCVSVTANCPATSIQTRSAGEGGSNARAGVSVVALPSPIPANQFNMALVAGAGMPAGVTFDGVGRVPVANIGTDITRVDVINAAKADARRMVIVVNPGGQIRMCDPAIPLASNPQGCS